MTSTNGYLSVGLDDLSCIWSTWSPLQWLKPVFSIEIDYGQRLLSTKHHLNISSNLQQRRHSDSERWATKYCMLLDKRLASNFNFLLYSERRMVPIYVFHWHRLFTVRTKNRIFWKFWHYLQQRSNTTSPCGLLKNVRSLNIYCLHRRKNDNKTQ